MTVAYAASGQPPFGTGESLAIVYRILHGFPDVAAVPATLRPLAGGRPAGHLDQPGRDVVGARVDPGHNPQRPGDLVWVITKTAAGFLAAGRGNTAGGGTQAVIWTSRDGLTWQRMTAAGLGLAGAGETVQSISYATYRGDATVIAGTVAAGGATYSGAWLNTSGGSAWTRVSIPVSNGAGDTISGLAFDSAGLIAVRPGGPSPGAASGVAYFSPNGLAWQYAGTVNAVPGWTPGVAKGTGDGFVVAGQDAAEHPRGWLAPGLLAAGGLRLSGPDRADRRDPRPVRLDRGRRSRAGGAHLGGR